MNNQKEIIYFNVFADENKIISQGIQFNEFFNSVKHSIKNVLLIKHNFFGGEFHSKTRFEYVEYDNLYKLAKDKTNEYGDFCWVDFTDVALLDSLDENDICELLFYGHLGKPKDKPFLYKLNSKFAYWAHDDGWHNEIYCINSIDYLPVISNAIINRLKSVEKKKINQLLINISSELLKLSEGGLIIDFRRRDILTGSIEIPIYVIGKIQNMDEMYNNIDSYINKSLYRAILTYKDLSWEIIENKSRQGGAT